MPPTIQSARRAEEREKRQRPGDKRCVFNLIMLLLASLVSQIHSSIFDCGGIDLASTGAVGVDLVFSLVRVLLLLL